MYPNEPVTFTGQRWNLIQPNVWSTDNGKTWPLPPARNMSLSSVSHLPPVPTQPQRHKPQTKTKQHDAVSLLQLCKSQQQLLQVHAFLIKATLVNERHVFGRLLLSFTSLKDPSGLAYAQKLFDKSTVPKNGFTYHTLIRGYNNNGYPREAFLTYARMVGEEEYVCPDEYVFTFVFSACSKLGAVFEGKQAHAQMVKCPLKFGTFTWNSLMNFYGKIGESGSVVRRLFDSIEGPNLVSWNCLIDGYVKSGDLCEARKVFDEMPERDVVSWTMMLSGYARAGLMNEASYLFGLMPERNLISWTTLIDGYVQAGCYTNAFDLFKEMQVARVEADRAILTILLSACAKSGAFDQGRWIHRYIHKRQIKVDAHLSTALIDMYSKWGEIDTACALFRETRDKKVFVWNAMLGGLAMHSFGEEAIELFAEMRDCGVEPNEITYINVLAACIHSGLVDVGLRVFDRMVEDQKFEPTKEHYGCVVDLLGRAGLLHDAFRVIQAMPMTADGSVWRALLSACRIHGNVQLAEEIGRILIQLEPENHMNYVLLANNYAMANRWDIVGKLRREMKVRGFAKTPGCSSIEIDGVVHEFVARDHSHPMIGEIFGLVETITNHLMQHEDSIDGHLIDSLGTTNPVNHPDKSSDHVLAGL